MASMGSDNSEIIDAAFALAEADWVLVASGAGLSADSGLDTYEGLRDQGVDYDILCRAELLYDKPALFHSFWLGSLLKYRGTAPHEGFQILENLLRERADMGRVYLYTSNVDGHLRHWGITSCSFMSFDSLFPSVPPAPQKKHWDPQSLHVCLPTEDSCRVFLCVKFMAAAKTGCVRHIWHRLLLKASVNAGSQCVKSSANSWMDETPMPPAVLRRHSNFHRMRAWTCWSAVVVFHSDQPFRCLGMKTKPFLTFCDKHGKPIRGGKTGWNES